MKSPHRRGDVPRWQINNSTPLTISPQTWGCTVLSTGGGHQNKNLPTDVGMYRCTLKSAASLRKSPHRRGDVPCWCVPLPIRVRISPQTWGCTGGNLIPFWLTCNLPTDVGMYRVGAMERQSLGQSPHRRGDVPIYTHLERLVEPISPQTWGCTGIYTSFSPCVSNLPTDVGMYRPCNCPRLM